MSKQSEYHDYLIAFDLIDDTRDAYKDLFSALQALGAKPLTDNLCVISNDHNASDLTIELVPRLRGMKDRLLVIRIDIHDCGSRQLMSPLCKPGGS